MAKDPILEALPEDVRQHIELLLEKADHDGYFRAKLEQSATRFGRPTVTQTPPKGIETKIAADGAAAAGVARRRGKTRKRGSSRGQAPKYVEALFTSRPVRDATPKDVVSAITETYGTELDFTQVRRALRALDEKGVVAKTGDKTWSSFEALSEVEKNLATQKRLAPTG